MALTHDADLKITQLCDKLRADFENQVDLYVMVAEELERITLNLQGAVREFDELFDGSCGHGPHSGNFSTELERKGSVMEDVFKGLAEFEISETLDDMLSSCKKAVERLKQAADEGEMNVED